MRRKRPTKADLRRELESLQEVCRVMRGQLAITNERERRLMAERSEFFRRAYLAEQHLETVTACLPAMGQPIGDYLARSGVAG